MTANELIKMINSSTRETKAKLCRIITDLVDLKEDLVNYSDDMECDLPDSIEEGRAPRAEDKWYEYREFCSELEDFVDEFENKANKII